MRTISTIGRSVVIGWIVLALAATWGVGGWIAARAEEGPPREDAKVRVLVVTGGHDWQGDLDGLFRKDAGVEFVRLDHQKTERKPLPTIAAGAEGFDVIVLYDMWQPISDAEKEGFARTVRGGKGLVVLHHALADFNAWPEFRRMIGGRYFLSGYVEDGVDKPGSTYQHDVTMKIQVAKDEHFITKGLADFELHDEAYNRFAVDPAAHVLLRATNPESGPVVAWTKPYGKGRVVAIQLGHDFHAFEDPSYRTLVSRSIRYAARRTPDDLASRPLFDGKSLAGWKGRGTARFSVEDGVLVGTQGDGGAAGDIFTEEELADFECEATWSMDFPGNSGLWFRFVDDGKAYQADFLEYKDPVCWSGSLYCPGKMFIARNEDATIVSRDGWNLLRVRAVGDHIRIWLNGRQVADVRDGTSARGRFGLQVHAGAEFERMAIRLADLRVRKLP